MNFKSLNLKISYESGADDLVNDFYIPVLQNAVEYNRIAGFFSSTSLSIASRGIIGLVKNGGAMKLLVSPRLSESDIQIIEKASSNPDEYLASKLIAEIEDINDLFERDHVSALGWLIAKGLLEIKVALLYDQNGQLMSENEIKAKAIFHQKVGVLRDEEGNVLSFSGSINETCSAWLDNVEEFKVFKLWDAGQAEYCRGDIKKFDDYWENKRENVEVMKLPDAVERHLMEKAPIDIFDLSSLKNYRIREKKKSPIEYLKLFEYQENAVKKWLSNNKKLIFEMATGTGKTRTAIGCIVSALTESKPVVVFIACPQGTLSLQWKSEIENLGVKLDSALVADSNYPNWKVELGSKLLDISLGTSKNLIVYTTHQTCSSADFINIIENNKKKMEYFFIGDEVHGLGAPKTRKGLIDIYDYRLGLSATPRRWYDERGTKIIYDFFGNESFQFTIKDALNTINPSTNKPFLVNYIYNPVFVSLTSDEINYYAKLSKKISKIASFIENDEDYTQSLESLLFKRANIHKSAFNKYEALEKILDSMSVVEDLIIFVTPEQLIYTMEILRKRQITSHRFSEKEGTVVLQRFSGRTERQFIIEKFKEKAYKALVAIKCLDEGIDIPSAKCAILLASSSNPREYIQRIGRVIRQAEGKDEAVIYDIIIKPDYSKFDPIIRQFEKKIFEKELCRALDMAENAINNAEASQLIFQAMRG